MIPVSIKCILREVETRRCGSCRSLDCSCYAIVMIVQLVFIDLPLAEELPELGRDLRLVRKEREGCHSKRAMLCLDCCSLSSLFCLR